MLGEGGPHGLPLSNGAWQPSPAGPRSIAIVMQWRDLVRAVIVLGEGGPHRLPLSNE